MTVKEVLTHTDHDMKIVLACNDSIIPFNRHDVICQDAFNNYVVDRLIIADGHTLEIDIKTIPLKAD